MPNSRILILAGTSEARALADQMSDAGYEVVSSFAGVTREPILPRGEVRHGGFGGTSGLVDYLLSAKITQVIDATHPFAAQMSNNAYLATNHLNLPLLRLERPAWGQQSSDHWVFAAGMTEAARHIPDGARVMVTTGRKNLEPILTRKALSGIVRTIEAPQAVLPEGWQVLLDRPPYTLEQERLLLHKQGITHLLCKNAGGLATVAKLTAAGELGIQVIMLTRPAKPACTTVSTIVDALQWLTTMGLESVDSQDSLSTSTKG